MREDRIVAALTRMGHRNKPDRMLELLGELSSIKKILERIAAAIEAVAENGRKG